MFVVLVVDGLVKLVVKDGVRVTRSQLPSQSPLVDVG